ncbi:MAG: type II secretion system F family protein [Actinomycetes bacterium]
MTGSSTAALLAALAGVAAGAAAFVLPRSVGSHELPGECAEPRAVAAAHETAGTRRPRGALALLLGRISGQRRQRCQPAALAAACHALAAELDAGSPPPVALAAVAAESEGALREALVALLADAGDDRPGGSGSGSGWDSGRNSDSDWDSDTDRGRDRDSDRALTALRVVWVASASSGSGLTSVLRQLATALQDDLRLEAEVRAALAGVKSSAVVVAALPAVGLLLGALLGGSPVSFLVGTPVGWGCAGLGGLLEAAGLCWLRALLRRVAP